MTEAHACDQLAQGCYLEAFDSATPRPIHVVYVSVLCIRVKNKQINDGFGERVRPTTYKADRVRICRRKGHGDLPPPVGGTGTLYFVIFLYATSAFPALLSSCLGCGRVRV